MARKKGMRRTESGNRNKQRKTTATAATSQPCWRQLMYTGAEETMVSQMHIPLQEMLVEDVCSLASSNTVEEEREGHLAETLDSLTVSRASAEGMLQEATYLTPDLTQELENEFCQWKSVLHSEVQAQVEAVAGRRERAFGSLSIKPQSKRQRERAHAKVAQEDAAVALMCDNDSADSDDEETLLRERLSAQQGMIALGGSSLDAKLHADYEQPKFGTIFESMKQASLFAAYVASRSAPYRVFPGRSEKHRVWVCGAKQSAAGSRKFSAEKKKGEADPRQKARRHGARAQVYFCNQGCKAVLEVQQVQAASLVRGSYRKSGFMKVRALCL